LVPEEVSRAGKDVRPAQDFQVDEKITPEEVSSDGKLAKLEQAFHASAKSVTEDESTVGKDVKLEQDCQVSRKDVTPVVFIDPNPVILVQPAQAPPRLVPKLKLALDPET
jgi:hypothetical protein